MADMGVQDHMAELQDHLKALRPEFSRRKGTPLNGDGSQACRRQPKLWQRWEILNPLLVK